MHIDHALRVLLILFAAVFIASCQSAQTATTSQLPGIAISITDGICPNVTIQAGDQVTWTNTGKTDHIVRDMTTKDMSQFDSGVLEPGNSFAYVFPKPGTFTYICSADGSMTGTVTVNP